MQVNNPLYKNQGIHVISALFTVEEGITKVLLIKRKNEPFKGLWALVGGALYNNEDLESGLRREVYEKSGIKDIPLYLVDVHGKVNRSPLMRMVAVSYIGVIDINSVNVLKETQNGAKVSIRTKEVDATKIAQKFNGGGHKRASGCTIKQNINTALEKLLEATKELI